MNNKWMLAETKKMKNNLTLRISLALSFIFMIYIVFDPFPYAELRIPTYISSVFLLSLTVFGAVPIIVLGAFLSHQEHSWNTFHHLLNSYSRVQSYIYKSSFILIASFTLTAITTILGLLVHLFIGAPGTMFSLQIIYQYFAVSIFCFFWGQLAFVVSLMTKSAIFSIVTLFLISFFEPALYFYISDYFHKYLVMFNQKGILALSFANLVEGSYLIVPGLPYPSLLWSTLYTLLMLIFISIVGLIFMKRSTVTS
ncbi:hypothetical protein [Oceanobacillus saliphilus]|uniref:hypothetical protein n=1 Tax=Oceanobacillus saliphilus TaxID=2925834 RepID=UPI00201D46B7|nr:hypothetical protein [Oceanobacillus saliphilus]